MSIVIKNELFDVGKEFHKKIRDGDGILTDELREEREEVKKTYESMFQVITYFEMFKSLRAEVRFNVDSICEYFENEKRARKKKSIIDSIMFLKENNFISFEEDEVPMKQNITIDILYDERYFRKYEENDIEKLSDLIRFNGKKYIIGLIYYYIVSCMSYNAMEDSYNKISLSYENIKNVVGVSKKSTVSGYVNFLVSNGFLKAEKRINENNGNTYKVYSKA